jgi:hypothetical protein
VCTYETVCVCVQGSGKGPQNWLRFTQATVYFDHPVHAMADHTLNIDLSDPAQGPSARVALELTAQSARALVAAIQEALDAVPAELTQL